MHIRSRISFGVLASVFIFSSLSASAFSYPDESVKDQIVYFLLPDRFADGDANSDFGAYLPTDGVDPSEQSEQLMHGHDRTSMTMHHGGDFQGAKKKLRYLKKLGMNTIWTAPPFGAAPPIMNNGVISSGYHGYWPVDFVDVDARFGGSEAFKQFVDSAHAKDMNVILDVILNHTANVIGYEECDGGGCAYSFIADAPYTDVDGNTFDLSDFEWSWLDGTDFPLYNESAFPYTPVIPAGLENIKKPEWLNDPIYYHNRGDYVANAEADLLGDFFNLDDLMSENPFVVQGQIDIFNHWVNNYDVDAFRLDAVRHINDAFFHQWIPAVTENARAQGKQDFYIFGENFEFQPSFNSTYIRTAGLDTLIDFPFQGAATRVVSAGSSTNDLRDLFADDDYYIDSDSNAYFLTTFLSNHDVGRFGAFVKRDNPDISDDEALQRVILANSLMMTARGIPVIYYGDEQGFTGIGADGTGFEAARQDMFPSLTPTYVDPEQNDQIGTNATPADDNFDITHPIYQAISDLATFRNRHKALRRGAQLHRYSEDRLSGVYAFSRIDRDELKEYLVVINTSDSEDRSVTIDTLHNDGKFVELEIGKRYRPFKNRLLCRDFKKKGKYAKVKEWIEKHYKQGQHCNDVIFADSEGNVEVEIAPLSVKVFKAIKSLTPSEAAPSITLDQPTQEFGFGEFFVGAELDVQTFAEVSFYAKSVNDSEYVFLGTDDNAPYRVLYDGNELPVGSEVEIYAEVRDYSGNVSTSNLRTLRIENRLQDVTVIYENGNNRNSLFRSIETGETTFPQAFSPEGYTFTWPEGEGAISLHFESDNNTPLIAYDRPLVITLHEVIANGHLVENGIESVLYVNNSHEISNVNNFNGAEVPSLPMDISAENPLDETIFLRGGMNDWGTGNPLNYEGNYTYTTQVSINEGLTFFKVANENWSVVNVGAPFRMDTGLTQNQDPRNMPIDIPAGEHGVYDYHYFMFPALDGSSNHYRFHRFERSTGPIGEDFYLHLNGLVDGRFAYLGGNSYELTTTLAAGSYEMFLGNSDLTNAVYGANVGDAAVAINSSKSLTSEGAALSINVGSDTEYKFTLDYSDVDAPVLSVEGAINYGPYGPIYLRGSEELSGVAGWGIDDSVNLFVYDEATQSLRLTLDVTSATAGNFEFKVAVESWATEFGGSGDQVPNGENYNLYPGGANLSLPAEVGIYDVVIDVANPAEPVLNMTNLGPYGAIYVRGVNQGWDATTENRMKYEDGLYTATIDAEAGNTPYGFKFADAEWGGVNGANCGLLDGTSPEMGVPFDLDCNSNNNLSLPFESGEYIFELDYQPGGTSTAIVTTSF